MKYDNSYPAIAGRNLVRPAMDQSVKPTAPRELAPFASRRPVYIRTVPN